VGSPKIAVVAVIELDGKHVRLIVTGPLTVDTQSALHPLIRLAGVVTPLARVVVDLTDAQLSDTGAVEALTRDAREGHTGHPCQRVRFILPGPALLAEAEDLRRLRAEQQSWATNSPVEDPHSTVGNISTVPAHPKTTAVTATVGHRSPRSSPTRHPAEDYDHTAAATAKPASTTQHVSIAAEPPTGTILPFRRPRHRPVMRSRPITSVAGKTAPGQIEA
jgi:hypothetical protein